MKIRTPAQSRTTYYIRFKSGSTQACGLHELSVLRDNSRQRILEAAPKAARYWSLGNSSTTVSYVVENYSGEEIGRGVVDVSKS